MAYANICIGCPLHFVPELIKMIQSPAAVNVALYIDVVIQVTKHDINKSFKNHVGDLRVVLLTLADN